MRENKALCVECYGYPAAARYLCLADKTAQRPPKSCYCYHSCPIN